MMNTEKKSLDVAVIGAGAAGAAGLAAARELLDCGHKVTVYEKRSGAGGIWRYDGWDGPMEFRSCQSLPVSPMYADLRTNIPANLMTYRDYGGVLQKENDAGNRYPSFHTVQEYLEQYMQHAGLEQVIRFGHEIKQLKPVAEGWQFQIATAEGLYNQVHQAVLVCNGHYQKPYTPDIEGIAEKPSEK